MNFTILQVAHVDKKQKASGIKPEANHNIYFINDAGSTYSPSTIISK